MPEPEDALEYVAKSPDRIWRRLKHLFETDDGSLPDTFIVGLNAEEVGAIYQWVRSNSDLHEDALAWR